MNRKKLERYAEVLSRRLSHINMLIMMITWLFAAIGFIYVFRIIDEQFIEVPLWIVHLFFALFFYGSVRFALVDSDTKATLKQLLRIITAYNVEDATPSKLMPQNSDLLTKPRPQNHTSVNFSNRTRCRALPYKILDYLQKLSSRGYEPPKR